jgi:hypothetical protein
MPARLRALIDRWRGASAGLLTPLDIAQGYETALVAEAIRAPDLDVSERPCALLDQRLHSLSVDQDKLREACPDVLANLFTTCSQCGEKERCASDFKDREFPAGWDSYCPNSGTLKTLL